MLTSVHWHAKRGKLPCCLFLLMAHPPVPCKHSPIRDLNWTGAVNLKFTFKDSPETTCGTKLVCGINCIDVAIHLVSKWEPSLVGKIGLWATQTTAAVPFTAPGGGGTQPRFHLFTCYCRLRRTLSFAPLLAASVERKALQHFYTHISRGSVCSLETHLYWHCHAGNSLNSKWLAIVEMLSNSLTVHWRWW